jgi:hypothetical protein
MDLITLLVVLNLTKDTIAKKIQPNSPQEGAILFYINIYSGSLLYKTESNHYQNHESQKPK